MKKYSALTKLSLVHLIVHLIFFLFGSKISFAQNSSYDVNSVPINGSENCSFGFQSLFSATSSSNSNSAFGYKALLSNTTGSGNVGVGKWALMMNTTGDLNIAIGFNALRDNLASSNIGIGAFSLWNNTTGGSNVAIGLNSLGLNSSGQSNIAIGSNSQYLSGANYNLGLGHISLYGNTTGEFNTAIGSAALFNNVSGNNNTALGYYANVGSGGLTNATAIGYGSIVNNSNSIQLGNSSVTYTYNGVGTGATFVTGGLQVTGGSPGLGKVLTSDASGVATWQSHTGGGGSWLLTGNAGTVDGTNFIGTTDNVPFNIRVNNLKAGRLDPNLYNTFFGIRSGNGNTFGSQNIAIGYEALYSNSNSSNLTAVGKGALYTNRNGTQNTAVGFEALYSNDDANGNTAFGYRSLYTNTAMGNTAIGSSAMFSNSFGQTNTAIGLNSLYHNTEANSNVAVGCWSMSNTTRGGDNTAIGSGSMEGNVEGEANSAVGYMALWDNTDGFGNTAVGLGSLSVNTTGSHNTALGYTARPNANNYTNCTMLGYDAIGTQSNFVRIGNASVQRIEAQVGITIMSDERVKENVKNDVPGLEFVNKLQPVTYHYNLGKMDQITKPPIKTDRHGKEIPLLPNEIKARKEQEEIKYTGFLAQQVEAVAKSIGFEFSGVNSPQNEKQLYGLRYSEFVVPLVKAVQELSELINDLKTEVEGLRQKYADLQQELASIKQKLTSTNQSKELSNLNVSEGRLYQNAPNPFNRATTLRYDVGNKDSDVIIQIRSINGVLISNHKVPPGNNMTLTINGGLLKASTYIFSLVVDGNTIDSKQMIVTK